MNEREFLLKLESRAKEQEALINEIPMSSFFAIVGIWLGKHPWRILIPLSFLLTLLFRLILGYRYTDFVLKIFGGFGLLR
ncbi:MAG: hypothetical protein HYT11_04690 [Candidatus Levybacteria bacterium]|nr:hypothetical protein [Candidatus Levybacteria bacterium]